ncbi:T9SS type A sorting domain-containing protein [Chryseobacterium arthrosphaerae]|uniref:T9SS type A sorting domain-containing protein n=1 Tax=Chryseobacterium arthrosphaerae TaxID=651561 RepID=UPI001F4A6BC6|nr:T9SS type A sorting domain-containing protein [Chryseobacterium arthrosphaerae]MDG4655272.1 T9SS type A sorting domain-containing protein [Chryseobacterium arthrosphaerae]
MKKTFYFCSFYMLFFLNILDAQIISVSTTCAPQTINFNGIQNSKNSYSGATPGNGFNLKIFWDTNTSRWVTEGWQGAYDIKYTSSLNTSPNPPSFATGNWISYGNSGFCPLTGLSGDGTTSINATVAIVNATCSTCSDGTASVTPSGSMAPYTFLWSPSGNNTATETNLLPGNYVVTITGADNNSVQKNVTVGVSTLAVIEQQKQTTISVFPSVTKDFITINSGNNSVSKAELFDISGKKVMDIPVKGSTTKINVSELSLGSYLLMLQTKDGIKTQKIIKQ